MLAWETLGDFDAIPAGTKVVEKGVPIFPRLDPDVEIVYIRDQMAITAPPEKQAEQAVEVEVEEADEITIDDFMKVIYVSQQ